MASSLAALRLAVAALAVSITLPHGRARAEELEIDVHGGDDDEEDEDPNAEKKRDDADRVHVSGSEPGSLASPIKLGEEPRVEKLCADVQGARGARDDQDLGELRAKKREAMRNVYSVLVDAGGFKVGDYKHRAGRLPLRLDHPLIALDGAVRMIVLAKAGGGFELAAKDAAAVVREIEAKRMMLEVVFRVDAGAESMAPCFSYPKSAAYALNVEPLRYALVEVGSNKRRAEAETPALDRLKRWMDPGKARLSIVVSAEGAIDAPALTSAVEAKRAELEACFQKVMQSASESGMLGFEAAVTREGAFAEVRLEAEALEDGDEASACVSKVLATVVAPKAAKASRAHVSLSIERGEDQLSPSN